jgi:hypothetical protein
MPAIKVTCDSRPVVERDHSNSDEPMAVKKFEDVKLDAICCS